MNIAENLRERVAGRWLLLAIIGGLVGATISGVFGAIIGFALVTASPMAISFAAYFWARSAEWARLSVAEEYGQAAQKHMEDANIKSLRETLDEIGQEALDEVERAIERRDEGEEEL